MSASEQGRYANDILTFAGTKTRLISNQWSGTLLTPFPILQMKYLQNIRIAQESETSSQSFCFGTIKRGRSLNSRDADVIVSCHKG